MTVGCAQEALSALAHKLTLQPFRTRRWWSDAAQADRRRRHEDPQARGRDSAGQGGHEVRLVAEVQGASGLPADRSWLQELGEVRSHAEGGRTADPLRDCRYRSWRYIPSSTVTN